MRVIQSRFSASRDLICSIQTACTLIACGGAMVLYNRISAIAHRLTGLKLKLSLLALGQLTLLMPVAAGAQTTFTGGGSISLTSTQTTSSSSTLAGVAGECGRWH